MHIAFGTYIEKCNRKFRRRTKKIKVIQEKILAVDSTTITTSKTQLKWAAFHGQKSGIKFHVQFDVENYMPVSVEESIAIDHDSKYADKFKTEASILVEDHGNPLRPCSHLSHTQRICRLIFLLSSPMKFFLFPASFLV